MRGKAWLVGIGLVGLCGCTEFAADPKELQAFRQDVTRFKSTCDKLGKQVDELMKLTTELKDQVALLKEAGTAVPSKPGVQTQPAVVAPGEAAQPRETQPVPGLCDMIETHIAAVEGVLSQPDLDSAETLLDDLQASFDANLRGYAQHPRIAQIRAAASTMRSEFLAAAKQTPLATNPYLKNVRQKSLNDARKAARALRSLCGD
jgi:hypothetical protein